MSALEQYSMAPAPDRHTLRAVPGSELEGDPDRGRFAAVVRLAERLLPGSILILDAAEPGDLRCWPAGLMGRRVSIDVLAAELMRNPAGAAPLWLARISEHEPFALLDSVHAAGPLAFAWVRPAGREGAALGVLRAEGPWSPWERQVVRDLASTFATECDRDRLRLRTAALIEESASAGCRDREPAASVAPLLTGACHELNNPLTSIKSFAELLLLDERSDEDREALEIVRREAHRAARIVADLRLVARQCAEAALRRDPEGEVESHTTAADHPAVRALHILVADADEPARYSIARYLERRGHLVEQTGSGEAALALIETAATAYDVILADLATPGMGGRSLRAHLRSRGNRAANRIILMGNPEPTGPGRFPRDADIPLLAKPFDLAEATQVVEVHATLTG